MFVQFVKCFSILFKGSACQLFENIKKRYSKRRVMLVKASRSDIGNAEMLEIERQMKEYEFLQWLLPFIRNRRCKTKCPAVAAQEEDSVRGYRDDGSKLGEVGESNSLSTDTEKDTSIKAVHPSDEKCKKFSKKAASVKTCKERVCTPADVHEEHVAVMPKIMKYKLNKNSGKEQNYDEIFGNMVASELAKLPEILKIQAKHEINNTIFKFQMQNQSGNAVLLSFASSSHPSSNTTVVGPQTQPSTTFSS